MNAIPLLEPARSNKCARSVLFLATAFLATVSSVQAAPLLSYGFDGLTDGTLAGQDGWVITNSAGSPVVSNGVSIDTTKVAGRAATAGPTVTQVKNGALFAAGSLTTASTIQLTFNVYVGTGGGSVDVFGIGGSSYGGGATASAYFGIFGNNFSVRSENNGTVVSALNSSGTALVASVNHWYTLESVWDLTTKTATLGYKDLTAGDTAFTALYFDAAQTQSTTAIAGASYLIDPSLWSTAYIRTGLSTNGIGYLDDLNVTVVPEPSSIALCMLGAAFVGLARRRL